MRVAFDQQVFAWQEYGGVSRYYCRLADNLAALPGIEAKIFAPFHVNAYLHEVHNKHSMCMKVAAFPKTGRLRMHVSRLVAGPLIRAYCPDVVHETFYSFRAPAPKKARRVVTAYDTIHEHYPGEFVKNDPNTAWKRKAFARADHIICISQSTRRDVLETFKVSAEKVSVVHLGFDFLGGPNVAAVALPDGKPYILYVGQRKGYKNFNACVRAYSSSEWLLKNFRLLCFGGGALSRDERDVLARQGVGHNHVQQTGGDDSALAACYRQAAALVYPSLSEGFGLPPLEAMSVGCPVVCSNTSSVPEVVGSAGEYFDPANDDSIRSALERVLRSSGRRAELIARGSERCRLFTWQRCAAETLAVYRKL